jgi:hypothetical protein
MEEGHGPFFDALSGWVAGGGWLIVVKGNHDLELYWPLVRRAVRDALVLHGAAPGAVEEAVAFADEGFAVNNVYVEHGHQYERMTQVRGSPVLAGRPAEINYPLGSFINRYFINRIELLDPFIQNRKPSEQALLALLRQRPVAIVKIYTGGWKFVVRAFAQVRTRQGALAVLLSFALVVPVITIGLIAAWLIFPGVRAWLLEWLPFLQLRWLRIGGSVGGSLFPALLPYLLGAAREVLKDIGILRATDTLAAAAPDRLAEQFPPATSPRCVYAMMGHTHVQKVERLPDSARRALYVNTGTWTALWPLDRPDLAGRIIYSVTRFRRHGGEYRLEALEWNDDAGETRAGRILVSA